MILYSRITQWTILFGMIFISMNSIEQAWAQNSTLEEEPNEDSLAFFSYDKSILEFLLFVIGIAIYSIFVWYFYRFISKRDFLPKFFYPVTYEKNFPIIKRVGYAASYFIAFPAIIFVWFIVLAFFVFLISKEMPFAISIFVSMAIIAVVRILAYYKEDSAKEVAKMIPYAILSLLLTSVAVYSDPNFISEKHLSTIPTQFMLHLQEIISAITVITIFEFAFRLGFIIKRKFRPAAEKKLEDEIENEVQEITKAHFKKIEQKHKEAEKKIDELLQKLNDNEKVHFQKDQK